MHVWAMSSVSSSRLKSPESPGMATRSPRGPRVSSSFYLYITGLQSNTGAPQPLLYAPACLYIFSVTSLGQRAPSRGSSRDRHSAHLAPATATLRLVLLTRVVAAAARVAGRGEAAHGRRRRQWRFRGARRHARTAAAAAAVRGEHRVDAGGGGGGGGSLRRGVGLRRRHAHPRKELRRGSLDGVGWRRWWQRLVLHLLFRHL